MGMIPLGYTSLTQGQILLGSCLGVWSHRRGCLLSTSLHLHFLILCCLVSTYVVPCSGRMFGHAERRIGRRGQAKGASHRPGVEPARAVREGGHLQYERLEDRARRRCEPGNAKENR